MNNDFTPEPSLQQVAEGLAQACVDFVSKHFPVKLDYSDASVEIIEMLLDKFHRDMASSAPSPEQIGQYGDMFGSYIGECLRRNHGAIWGSTPNGSQKAVSMSMSPDGSSGCFFPWARAYKRITVGDTEGVYAYYQWILEKSKEGATPPPLPKPPPLPEKKSLFGRFFGK